MAAVVEAQTHRGVLNEISSDVWSLAHRTRQATLQTQPINHWTPLATEQAAAPLSTPTDYNAGDYLLALAYIVHQEGVHDKLMRRQLLQAMLSVQEMLLQPSTVFRLLDLVAALSSDSQASAATKQWAVGLLADVAWVVSRMQDSALIVALEPLYDAVDEMVNLANNQSARAAVQLQYWLQISNCIVHHSPHATTLAYLRYQRDPQQAIYNAAQLYKNLLIPPGLTQYCGMRQNRSPYFRMDVQFCAQLWDTLQKQGCTDIPLAMAQLMRAWHLVMYQMQCERYRVNSAAKSLNIGTAVMSDLLTTQQRPLMATNSSYDSTQLALAVAVSRNTPHETVAMQASACVVELMADQLKHSRQQLKQMHKYTQQAEQVIEGLLNAPLLMHAVHDSLINEAKVPSDLISTLIDYTDCALPSR